MKNKNNLGLRPRIIAAVLFASSIILAVFFCQWVDRVYPIQISVLASTNVKSTAGQIYWSTGERKWSEERVIYFEMSSGLRDYFFEIPSNIRELRVDVGSSVGDYEIRRLSLLGLWHFPILSWSGKRLWLWLGRGDVEQMVIDGRGMRFHSRGSDPFFELGNGVEMRNRISWYKSALFSILALIFAIPVIVFVLWVKVSPSAPAVDHIPTQKGVRSRERAVSFVLFFTILFLGGIAIEKTYFWLEAKKLRAKAVDPKSEIWVDHLGNPLFHNVERELQIVLDPFTQYRLSAQKSDTLYIDANGFRGGIASSKRPKAFITGGSVAYGFGVSSDDHTLSADLNRDQSQYQFINAAVPGFYSGQELSLMINRLVDYKPKLFLSVNGANDLIVPLIDDAATGEEGYNVEYMLNLEMQIRSLAPKEPIQLLRVDSRPKRDRKEVTEAAARAYMKSLSKMKRVADSFGVNFLQAFQPAIDIKRHLTNGEEIVRQAGLLKIGKTYGTEYRGFVDTLMTFCKREGIPCIDLGTLPDLRDDAAELFLDFHHLNDRGIGMVARALIDKLQLHPDVRAEGPDKTRKLADTRTSPAE